MIPGGLQNTSSILLAGQTSLRMTDLRGYGGFGTIHPGLKPIAILLRLRHD